MLRVVLGLMLIAAGWLPEVSAQENGPAPQQPQSVQDGKPDAQPSNPDQAENAGETPAPPAVSETEQPAPPPTPPSPYASVDEDETPPPPPAPTPPPATPPADQPPAEAPPTSPVKVGQAQVGPIQVTEPKNTELPIENLLPTATADMKFRLPGNPSTPEKTTESPPPVAETKPTPPPATNNLTPRTTVTIQTEESRQTSVRTVAATQVAPLEVEAAQLKGAQPGRTTAEELFESWGHPRKSENYRGFDRHAYEIPPFADVIVTVREAKVTSIAVRFEQALEARQLARDLALDAFEAVIVADDNGELLGQVYPERGVLFTFEVGGQTKVKQIVMESIDAEPFVLRAEANWQRDYQSSLKDVRTAQRLSPNLVRAQWLESRILLKADRAAEALEVIDKVLTTDPNNPKYRLTRISALEQLGNFVVATSEARKLITEGDIPPHIRAMALRTLGDLISNGPGRDYKRSLEMHQAAIRQAEPLLSERNLEVHQAALDVLVGSHLGVSQDIAWGRYKGKERVVPRWLEQSQALAKAPGLSDWKAAEYEFRVARTALSAHVGMQEPLADDQWPERALSSGRKLLVSTTDTLRQQQIEWELGTAMHDALQLYLMMGKFDPALKYGSLAVRHLERGSEGRDTSVGASYMVARCYFRVGSIYAMHYQDHEQAASWFDKAVPLLEGQVPVSALADIGRQGETLVSIGVSFWETGRKEDALRVTGRGLELMEQAVRDDILTPTALNVPYSNLATMHRALGAEETAKNFERMATKNSGEAPIRQ